ncbi:FAD-dependent oxidoreductase [Streptomyces sp. NPDC054783]
MTAATRQPRACLNASAIRACSSPVDSGASVRAARFKSIGADLFRGHGLLDGPRRVSVTRDDGARQTLTARHAVAIATGSLPNLPDIPGIEKGRPWTNRHGTDSSTVPARLAIIGGGGAGIEMATLWQGLGSQVALLARRRLIPRMESFATWWRRG